jgi:hypothetical protein
MKQAGLMARSLAYVLAAAVTVFSLSVQAADKLKPFVLASQNAADLTAEITRIKAALTGAGFAIAGEVSPYKNTHIIVVTNDELKKNAAASKHGGYGAAQRVSVTKVNDQVQVAFTNPVYMANVYRMKGDLAGISSKLKTALGFVKDFGASGIEADDLRKYHYKIFMPYFDDPYELKSFDSYDDAVKSVENGLAAKAGGVSKVYRIDIPGKKETVFGIHMTNECSGDEFIMKKIDFGAIKSSAHLPYEILVSGNEVFALHGKFRIAISFPDLSMVGNNSFFSIMCAPGEIEDALEKVVKGK